MSGITDREPDAWTWEARDGMWICIATPRDNAGFCTEPGEHVERDTPLWLVSAADLAARDEAVRRENLAAHERTKQSLRRAEQRVEAVRREVLAEVARARHIAVEFDCEGCGETLKSTLDVLGGSYERGRAWPNALGETIKHRCAKDES